MCGFALNLLFDVVSVSWVGRIKSSELVVVEALLVDSFSFEILLLGSLVVGGVD